MNLKYDASAMKYFSVFENVTKTSLKDCFLTNNTLIFCVESGKAKLAVGKDGLNIKKLNNMLNKDIKVIEFSKNIVDLVRNSIFPLRTKSIEIVEEEDKKIINISFKSSKERRILLDNDQKKLKLLKEIIKRYDPKVTDIRILQL
jgi:transcription termination/antitermination protein NusA